ncbi:MAG: TIGR03000 domain-containing protein [Gemmataceae bacterium]
MYSVVLAAMMSTSTAAPDCWWRCCYPPPRVYSCCGGCYGYVAYRPVVYAPYASCFGCYGYPVAVYSCGGCYGSPAVAAPMAAPSAPAKPQAQPLPAPKQGAINANKATVVFKAPLDVKISIEGNVINRTNVEEAFATPALENGKTYSYNILATKEEDGKNVSFSKKVSVTPGTSVVVEFVEFNTTQTVSR